MTLHPSSEWEAGTCRLWQFVSAGGGWYRLQIKHGGQYLDATNCGATMGLNPGSTLGRRCGANPAGDWRLIAATRTQCPQCCV